MHDPSPPTAAASRLARFAVLATAGLLAGCSTRPPAMTGASSAPAAGTAGAPAAEPAGVGDELIAALLREPRLAAVVADPAEHRVQILVGTIVPGTVAGAPPRLARHGYRLDAEYFYPASTVKLPAAAAAVEALGVLRRATGQPVGLDTPLTIHPLFPDQELEASDPGNLAGGTLTLGQEIRKVFLVSDNASFNRLYAFVGQEALNRRLWDAGLPSARIVHRLSEVRTAAENRRAPRIDFHGSGPSGEVDLSLPERTSALELPPTDLPGLRVGHGYVGPDDRVVDEPLDFTPKNRVSLTDLQNVLAMVVRPDVDLGLPAGSRPFDLDPADRAFLLQAMSELPRESGNPRYDPAEYPDDYVKFLLPGLLRVAPRSDWEIYDKTGLAYGFTIENAYVVHRPTGAAFFLATTLYANSDGVLNDDHYDYDTVALPFIADLAEALARRVVGAAR